MIDDGWRTRLRAAIAKAVEQDGVDYITLAKDAKRGRNFVQQYATTDKVPSVVNFLLVCEVVKVAPVQILLGLDVTPEDQEFLLYLSKQPADERANLMRLLKAVVQRESGS